jgi:hypothetical protein
MAHSVLRDHARSAARLARGAQILRQTRDERRSERRDHVQ